MKKRIISLLSLAMLTANLFAGQIFYVTETGAGNKDGSSWANAFANVQSAIDAVASVATSESPSEVWISKGTYKHGSAMTMKNNVAIYGGFAGTETRKEERVSGNNTYLDGEKRYRVFYNNYTEDNPLTNSAKLDNVTIQNGKAENGGGMYNDYASPTLTNCTFSGNTAIGAVNNVFVYGGGMYNNKSSPTLTDCIFSGNSASGENAMGGGMCNVSSTPIVMACTFVGNRATGSLSGARYSYGGGMYNDSSDSKVINCSFLYNEVVCNGVTGGGVYNIRSKPEFTNCTFYSNKVRSTGSGSLYVYSLGGGMHNGNSSPRLINCTFSGNEAISDYATSYGGAINNDGVEIGNTIFLNCIFWGNIASSRYNEIYNNTSSCKPNLVNCIIKDGYTSSYGTATGTITEDPKFGELGNYGGKVQTIPVLVGSSAIGVGASGENIPTSDARGVARSASAPTIGAYEAVPPTIMENPKSVLGAVNQDVSISIFAKSALGDDNISYQWQFLNSNGEWEDIEGAAESIYTIQNCKLEQDGSKYRCVVSNVFDGLQTTSEEAALTVYPSVSQVTLSTNRITIVDGGYGYLEVSSDAFQPTYKWYYSADTGLTWVEIENSNSSVLEFQAESSMNRRQYKCVVTDGGGTSVESGKAVLIINSNAITISQDIADTTAFIGKETILSVSANSSSTLGYQWQVSTDNGATWVDIKDATSSSLSLIPEDYELSGNLYRCKIDNGGGFIYSSNSKITVFKNVEITSQPVDLIVWNTKNAEFEVSATGDGTVKYQWQALVGEEWQDIENATSPNLFLENVSTEMNGSKYRCVVSNEGTATLYSSEATLTVYKTLEIITQPKETYTFEGDGAAFSVEVDAQGDVSYQWQELILGVWTDIENEASSILEIPAMENSYDGRMFRVVVSNGGDDFISEIAELKLARPLEITSQPQNIATAYIGKTAVFKVEADGYEPQYQWYVSGNYGADTGVEIEGANSSILTLQVEDESILENVYFCKITNAKATLSTDLVYVNEVQTLSAFQEWSMENGLGVDASPTATPHNDGITNLEKYAFGLDGSAAASYAAQPLFAQTNDGETASFQYPISKDAVAIRVKALVSEDLINWIEASATANGESGNFNLFKVENPLPASGRLFFKVEVSED